MTKASKKGPRYQDRPGLVNVIFQLKDSDAQRLLDYEEREKLRTHGQAVYKLMFERLDQVEAAAETATTRAVKERVGNRNGHQRRSPSVAARTGD